MFEHVSFERQEAANHRTTKNYNVISNFMFMFEWSESIFAICADDERGSGGGSIAGIPILMHVLYRCCRIVEGRRAGRGMSGWIRVSVIQRNDMSRWTWMGYVVADKWEHGIYVLMKRWKTPFWRWSLCVCRLLGRQLRSCPPHVVRDLAYTNSHRFTK